jgi:hypothetical protein
MSAGRSPRRCDPALGAQRSVDQRRHLPEEVGVPVPPGQLADEGSPPLVETDRCRDPLRCQCAETQVSREHRRAVNRQGHPGPGRSRRPDGEVAAVDPPPPLRPPGRVGTSRAGSPSPTSSSTFVRVALGPGRPGPAGSIWRANGVKTRGRPPLRGHHGSGRVDQVAPPLLQGCSPVVRCYGPIAPAGVGGDVGVDADQIGPVRSGNLGHNRRGRPAAHEEAPAEALQALVEGRADAPRAACAENSPAASKRSGSRT